MSNTIKKTLLTLTIAGLSACQVPAVSMPSPEGGSVSVPGAEQISAPAVQVGITATVQTFSALKDWGFLDSEMPIDFTAIRLGHEERLDFHQFEDGFFQVDGRQIRRCVGKIKLDGTEEAGTATVYDMDLVWSIDPQGDLHSTYCTDMEGTFSYHATAAGLEFAGRVYSEVVEQ